MEVKTIGVIGAGQMGSGIAQVAAAAGFEVIMNDIKDEFVARGVKTIDTSLGRLVKKEKLSVEDQKAILGRIKTSTRLEDMAGADFVVEAATENVALKLEIFRKLDAICRPGVVLSSNTSSISITKIAGATSRPELVIGMHFMNPVPMMALVEVIRGEDTPDSVMDAVCGLVESIGKRPVRVEKDVPGFIGNRMLHALWREAVSLVERGIASPQDVDLVARLTFGLRLPVMGPLENMDLVGLDLIERIHEYLLADLADNHAPAQCLRDSVTQGRLGVKSGAGFYDWRAREPAELIRRRDTQIVRQLAFLRELEDPENHPQ